MSALQCLKLAVFRLLISTELKYQGGRKVSVPKVVVGIGGYLVGTLSGTTHRLQRFLALNNTQYIRHAIRAWRTFQPMQTTECLRHINIVRVWQTLCTSI